ncbi:MAG: PAS domain-containing protein [Thermodesulfobacteriota bacterium]
MRQDVRSAAGKLEADDYGARGAGGVKPYILHPARSVSRTECGECWDGARDESENSSIESSRNGFFFLNAEGAIVHCNKAFKAMLLYDEEDLAGVLIQDVVAEWTGMTWLGVSQRIEELGYCKLNVEMTARTGVLIPVAVELGLYFKADERMFYGAVCRPDDERLDSPR